MKFGWRKYIQTRILWQNNLDCHCVHGYAMTKDHLSALLYNFKEQQPQWSGKVGRAVEGGGDCGGRLKLLKLPWHIPHTQFDKYFIVIPGKAFTGIPKPAIMGKGCLLLRESRNASSLLLQETGQIQSGTIVPCAHPTDTVPSGSSFLTC